MNLKDVKARVRSILGDPDGDWVTDQYIEPMINHVYDLQILYLEDTGATHIEAVKVVPNIQAGTSDLTDQGADPTKPLYGLIEPYDREISWKPAGTPDNFYRYGTRTDVLPDWVPGTGNYPIRCMYWEWRAYTLHITPFTYNIDLRVRGDFKPPPLIKETDIVQVHPLLGSALAEETAQCAMRERANPGQMQAYQLVGTVALDNISNLLVRDGQGESTRVGRANGRGRRWGYGWR